MNYEKVLDKKGVEIFVGDKIIADEDIKYEGSLIPKGEELTITGFPTDKKGIQVRYNNKDVVLPANKVLRQI